MFLVAVVTANELAHSLNKPDIIGIRMVTFGLELWFEPEPNRT
jgi:hypothetical protein